MNILLTSIGRRSYLVNYFKKALNGNGKVYAANSEYTYSMNLADGSFILPLIYSDGYINALLEKCIEFKIDIIISCFDIDLLVLANNKSIFEKYGISVLVSDPMVVDLCNDKWKTYLFCRDNGFLCPKTYLDLNSAYYAINEKQLQFPVILKPRWGMGSIGIYNVDNLDELRVFYVKVIKEIKNSYLKYESRENLDSCVLVQEKLNGKEYNIDIINDLSGNYVLSVPKLKLQMRAGETDVAEIEDTDKFELFSRSISVKLKHILNLDLDCIVDNSGIHVIDMNCRFGGGFPFSYLAGVDLPLQIIRWLSGERGDKSILDVKHYGIFCKNIVPVKFC